MNDAALLVITLLSFSAFAVSLICVAMIAGFTRSTHTVQYLPVDDKDLMSKFEDTEEVAKENEEAILSMVGRKKRPTVVDPIDAPLEEISQSDINF